MLAPVRLREPIVLLAGALAACSLAFPMDSFRGHLGANLDAGEAGTASDGGAVPARDAGEALKTAAPSPICRAPYR
jgi:hypothetical protein